MSVWKRFQRVGKKAAKFQFTASYTELCLETNNFKPSRLVITWLRRNRKYPSEPIELQQIQSTPNSYSYIWAVPQNQEIQTTLYRMKKEIDFEEKDWTFQIEDIVNGGSRRRLLAYRNVNVSQYADLTPTQNSIKISFKISSKKVKSVTLFLTLSAVFLREGEATDEDMISVASLMSLPSNPSFIALPSNDVAVLSDLDDLEDSNEQKDNINEKINELCDQIGNLNWDTNKISEANLEKDESFSSNFLKEEVPKPQTFLSKSSSVKVEYNDDRLYNIAEDDYSVNNESNSTSDLLDWCQSITNNYPDVKVTNFTTSFRNGMAFCAIIHHFHPNLIDFDSLKPSNVKENNRIAFTAAGSLGIPKVLDPNEMNFLKIPDSLSVMTYLHQLKTHFTDNNLVLTPASAGNYSKQSPSSLSTSPTETKNINNLNFPTLTDIIEETPSTSVHRSPEIQTDKDNVVETQINSKEADVSKSPEKPVILKPVPNKSPKKQKKVLSSFNIDGTVKDKWSLSEKKIKPVSLGTLNLFSEQDSKENHTNQSPKLSQTNGHPVSPRFSNRIVVKEDININDNYITAETKALEREQDKIDDEASELEKQIRQVMGKDRKKEAILMDKWFHIVNKKNALIRRNMQLQILEKEQNLELKWNLLQNELRQIISIEDWSKTEEMKRREELLMKELVNIINQRDKVVKDLDEYEQGIGSDIEWARENPDQVSISNIFSKSLAHAKFTDKNCVIQ